MEESMRAGNTSTLAKPGWRLRELGLVLPEPPSPLGAYVEASQVGALLFLSGTLPLVNRKLAMSGRLGANLSVDQGREVARLAALNALGLEEINNNRRRFLGIAAITIAANRFGVTGSARAQSNKTTPADLRAIKVQQMAPAAI
jgi:hypothetical protein